MSNAGPAARNGDPAAALAAIWARHRDNALERVAVLEDAVAALIEHRLSEVSRQAAEREAHRLAGSAGTFGFPAASESARHLEGILAGAGPVPLDRILTAAEEVVSLRTALEAGPRPAPVPPPPSSPATGPGIRRLLIAVGQEPRREQLRAGAAARGFQPLVVSSPEQVEPGGEAPVAALVDLNCADDAGIRLIAHLTAFDPPIPALALAPTDLFSDRLEAVRAGARGFLGAAAPPEEVFTAVEKLLSRTRPHHATILVVDDDPAILAAVGAVLESTGLRMVGLEDPARFYTVLADARPDLVILDLDMPRLRGDELCRVVRSDPRWSGLPILFLTAHIDHDTVGAIFAAGADDFIAKPFSGQDLAGRVKNRLERTRILRHTAETDPLTGLPGRQHAEPRLEMLLGGADRHRRPMSIARLDLDNFTEINNLHGQAMGDRILRRIGSLLRGSFSPDDVVARWDGDEFLLGLHGTAGDGGVQQIAALLATLRNKRFIIGSGARIPVSFSAGIASYPSDAATLPGLCEEAFQALQRARGQGGDRVLAAARADHQAHADVVIVEDDEALAELLEHALTLRGYSSRHLASGQDAARQLTGVPPALQARVVLLDVDLPVLNGFGVLRQMAAAGTLSATRVIMLTARAGEREVLDALELGAFDHVAKPFSVPVLMQRISRALGTA